MGDITCLDEDVTFCFQGSGHILNSAQVMLWLSQGNTTKKIAYSSDLGNIAVPKFFTSSFSPIDKCNLFIGECTYSDVTRAINYKNRLKDIEKMRTIIEETCLNKGGKVLFPVFANDRCQNILTFLYSIFGEDRSFNVPILIDSPMAVKITQIYKELVSNEERDMYQNILSWDNVRFVEEYNTSKMYQGTEAPMIILSCSGMMMGGRSISWASHLLPSIKNHIVFVGYSPPGSLAAKIRDGKQKTITIDGKPITNRCNITNLVSFSSHMQYHDLLQYYSSIKCEKIALVHGEKANKPDFAKALQGKISQSNNCQKVVCVNKGTELLI